MTNKILSATALVGVCLMIPVSTNGQSTGEVFTATAVVKSADGKSASAPVTITIDRKMSEKEAGSLANAFKAGGAAALRKGLEGVPVTGNVRIGSGTATPNAKLMQGYLDATGAPNNNTSPGYPFFDNVNKPETYIRNLSG